MDRIQRCRGNRLGLLLCLLLVGAGCSVKRVAVNAVGNALAESGSAFASDDDPALIRDAAPFSLKLMESLLAENPRHRRLLLAAARGFTQYSYAFVHQEADRWRDESLAKADAHGARARRLYIRGRDYGLRGLELAVPGTRMALGRDPRAAVMAFRKKHVPLLFWTAAAWAGAISVSKDDPELIADQPQVEALMDRALELDEAFDQGAIHTFLISYEPARPGVAGDAAERARRHFNRAMELSEGNLAGPLLALAESVALQEQRSAEFRALLERALAIDVDANPEARLVNLILQERARWLLSRMDDLFLPLAPE